ncbi:GNAT family N-acetyltransferase [Lentilactobacillus sp. Marseille-Q4993]|uniref:GNAT family N-acetyltransferase n=1 Tax=Lentilactobacillus sp. Marseille-Q4993 TaxID=3039492 RepID=UPI0024BC622C|nr:GNAT family N-acetyltransferase [Lentilactobacillus sp. Marseille-Q4993]
MTTIRPITSNDDVKMAEIIRTLLKSFNLDKPGTAYFDPELDHLSEFYGQTQKRQYFVAVNDDNEVVGGAGAAEYDAENGVAELQKLYVSASAQGDHLSTKLIDRVVEFARQAGYEKLYLETHHDLSAAVHVYDKYGFTLLDGPIGGGEHQAMDIFYELKLKK